jgi:CubicO group peptidase (beta-lactamase class C family)
MGRDPAIFERIEKLVSAELESRKHPGSSVSVMMGDKMVWADGFGHSNIEEGAPATPETVYRCASVTKPVVTTGFLQLMEKGKFQLDDPVNDHLNVKIKTKFEETPTIRDLLTHYSGMPTRVPPLFIRKEEALTLRDYIEEAARAVQPPLKSWAYCNTAFAIVGHLIELFTGHPYDSYVRDNVLKPLKMDSSDFELTPVIEGSLAQGYKRAGGPDQPLQAVEPYILGTIPQDPAGSLYSTVKDLANFVIANMNCGVCEGHRVLREETVEEMHRLQASPGDSMSGMALSWFRNLHDGHVMLSHTGGLPDYTNHVAFYPDLKIGVCWLSNLNDGSGWRPPAPTALRIAAGEFASFNPETFQTVPDEWRSIVGAYGSRDQKVTVKAVNGFLLLEGMGAPLYLEKTDGSRYLVHGTHNDGYELTFEYDDEGVAKQFDLGNSVVPRYAEEEIHIDESADLTGSWRGEYVDSLGFHALDLEVESATQATVTDMEGRRVALSDFKAENGRISGTCSFSLPAEYARWGTEDELQVEFELAAVNDQLKGLIRTRGFAVHLILEKV